jgi:hypothetical protein
MNETDAHSSNNTIHIKQTKQKKSLAYCNFCPFVWLCYYTVHVYIVIYFLDSLFFWWKRICAGLECASVSFIHLTFIYSYYTGDALFLILSFSFRSLNNYPINIRSYCFHAFKSHVYIREIQILLSIFFFYNMFFLYILFIPFERQHHVSCWYALSR